MISLVLPRPPDVCYRAFCDVSSARLWVPGLKKVRQVRADAAGHALEVWYEYGDSMSYALVYAYDDASRRVRWVPSAGALDGVSGHAEFEPHSDGCLLTYTLTSLREHATQHEDDVASGFAQWIARGAQSAGPTRA